MRKILLFLVGAVLAGAVGAAAAIAWLGPSRAEPVATLQPPDPSPQAAAPSPSVDLKPIAQLLCEAGGRTYNALTERCTGPRRNRRTYSGGGGSGVGYVPLFDDDDDEEMPLPEPDEPYNPFIDDYDEDGSPDRLDNCPMDPYHSVTDDCS